ncbi:hypothetical protein [Ralstonia syzygii]|nr:hypothetical protein [Ralstonia syzygii]
MRSEAGTAPAARARLARLRKMVPPLAGFAVGAVLSFCQRK